MRLVYTQYTTVPLKVKESERKPKNFQYLTFSFFPVRCCIALEMNSVMNMIKFSMSSDLEQGVSIMCQSRFNTYQTGYNN